LKKLFLKKLLAISEKTNFLFYIMHPVKHHLLNKFIWMSRQLRKMNDSATITSCIADMQSVYTLLDHFSENGKMVLSENQRSKVQNLTTLPTMRGYSTNKTKVIDNQNTKEEA
jgi:hypothetical protein